MDEAQEKIENSLELFLLERAVLPLIMSMSTSMSMLDGNLAI